MEGIEQVIEHSAHSPLSGQGNPRPSPSALLVNL
jgi:hypothetical protein